MKMKSISAINNARNKLKQSRGENIYFLQFSFASPPQPAIERIKSYK